MSHFNLPSACFGVTTLNADCELLSGDISMLAPFSAVFTWIFRFVTPSALTFRLKSNGNWDAFIVDTSIFNVFFWKNSATINWIRKIWSNVSIERTFESRNYDFLSKEFFNVFDSSKIFYFYCFLYQITHSCLKLMFSIANMNCL